MKVCIICAKDMPDNLRDLSDEKWLSIAKESGSVYTIKEFETVFNGFESFTIDPDSQYIRFIND